MNQIDPRFLSLLRVAFGAFVLGAVGVALGFIGWYVVASRPLAIAGFVLTAAGVCIGATTIVVGQVIYGRAAVTGSIQAIKGLRDIIRGR